MQSIENILAAPSSSKGTVLYLKKKKKRQFQLILFQNENKQTNKQTNKQENPLKQTKRTKR